MITAPKDPQGYLASIWMAGVALAMLVIGVHGATQPLLPRVNSQTAKLDLGNEVLLEQFNPPAAATLEQPQEPQPVEPPDLEIPPIPAIQPALTPPEMVELTPLDQPPPPVAKATKVSPMQTPKAPSEPKVAVAPPKTGGGGGGITTFTGGGSGRFPLPPYPAAARAGGVQGTVKLLVTVEASGLPSSVTIESSSGSATLDNAARDHISRRWRWPAGETRRYIVPIRFLLQR